MTNDFNNRNYYDTDIELLGPQRVSVGCNTYKCKTKQVGLQQNLKNISPFGVVDRDETFAKKPTRKQATADLVVTIFDCVAARFSNTTAVVRAKCSVLSSPSCRVISTDHGCNIERTEGS